MTTPRFVCFALLLLATFKTCAQDLPDSPHPKREIIEHVLLTGTSETFSMLDARSTRQGIQIAGARESDPIFRPFVHSDGLYAVQTAEITALGWVGWKMHHSRYQVLRNLWWVPQTAQIGANLYGWRNNVAFIQSHRKASR